MNKLGLRLLIVTFISIGLSACGGGGGGDSTTTPTAPTGTTNPTPAPPTQPEPLPPVEPIVPSPVSVSISGVISFDKVRQTSTSNAALNYNTIDILPARGIVVEALNSTGTTIANTVTDQTGNYTLNVTSDTDIRIRAKAQLLDTNWDFKVTDNTNNDALYVLDGSLSSTGATNSTRNLHADSGWGGTAYTNTRAAAPFAMLDVVFNGIQQIVAVNNRTIFPAAEIRWSINNRPSSGLLTNGDISTSFFTITNGLPTVYILGAENVDTDEYDEDVVAHEWGHYIESQLSRSDSIGGNHSLIDHLDMRVAFSEGLGNALSGIINGDNFYVDSFGNSQANGFAINLETKSNASPTGWFSEDSIQTLLFDIADSNNEGQDTLSLGMGGLIQALTADNYKNSAALTSIFTFAESFKSVDPASSVGLDNLLSANGINSDAGFATGENNNGGLSNVLPIYTDIIAGGSTVNLCSTNARGEPNKLGNFRFVRLDISQAETGVRAIELTRTSGATTTDPDFFVFKDGQIINVGDSSFSNRETEIFSFQSGTHVIAITDFLNIDNNNTTGGVSCFDLSVR